MNSFLFIQGWQTIHEQSNINSMASQILYYVFPIWLPLHGLLTFFTNDYWFCLLLSFLFLFSNSKFKDPQINMSLLFLFSCGLLHLDPWYFLPDEVHEPGMWHNFQFLLFSNMYIVYICVNGILKEKKQDQRVLLTYYHKQVCFCFIALYS